jgi:transcriptional regulator with XRE-family HTH domain
VTPRTQVQRLPLHERIVWARKRKGLSQERLAEKIGTSRRHMIRIEKGRENGGHRPGPELIARIAEATGQPVALFADDEEEDDDLAASLVGMFRTVIRREMASLQNDEVVA